MSTPRGPALSYVLTHPEVAIDPSVPVTAWGLSLTGRARAALLSGYPWATSLRRIISSAERKATETAAVLGADLGLDLITDPELGENDRSATGFLPAAEFEATADAFFAEPSVAVRGWETAEHAQARIVAAVRRWVWTADEPTAYVTHGAVGTLLWCSLAGRPIDRRHDQPGQGSWYGFDPQAWSTTDAWRRIDRSTG